MKIFFFYPIGQARTYFNDWDFDCNAFSAAFTCFYNQHFVSESDATRYYYIGLRVDRNVRGVFGLYQIGGAIFLCDLLSKKFSGAEFEKQIFKTLLHEIMHWMQFTFYKWSEEEIIKGEIDNNCDAEKMCRSFEKQYRPVLKIYKTLRKIKKSKHNY